MRNRARPAIAVATAALALCASTSQAALLDKTTGDTAPISGCADFRGEWRGACVDSDVGTKSEVLNVEQIACKHVRLGRIWVSAGGVTQASAVFVDEPSFYAEESVQADWNSDRSALMLVSRAGQRDLGEASGSGHTSDGSLALDADTGELVLAFTSHDDANAKRATKAEHTVTCRYKRLPAE